VETKDLLTFHSIQLSDVDRCECKRWVQIFTIIVPMCINYCITVDLLDNVDYHHVRVHSDINLCKLKVIYFFFDFQIFS